MSAELVVTVTQHSVSEVVDRLQAILARRGIQVFAVIDHAAAARAAGLELPDETVVIFGDPAVGTRLMQTDPRTGIDLPLRILAWSDDGQTRVAYRPVTALADSFGVRNETAPLEKLDGVLSQLVAAVTADPSPDAGSRPETSAGRTST